MIDLEDLRTKAKAVIELRDKISETLPNTKLDDVLVIALMAAIHDAQREGFIKGEKYGKEISCPKNM